MLRRSVRVRSLLSVLLLASLVCSSVGCNREGRQFVDIGTAPSGGVFFVMGTALTEVLNEHRGEQPWRVQAKGTRGSQENIRRLETGELQLGMSNSAISYFAYRGESGWDKSYEIRAVMSLAPNVGMFLTRRDSGIQQMSDLRGRRVIVGPDGAGFEMFVGPILEAHGVSWNDFSPVNAAQDRVQDMLSDGQADAAFMGGAVPTPGIRQVTDNLDIRFLPYDDAVREELVQTYPFFHFEDVPHTIRREQDEVVTYRGMTEDFPALDVGKMHLITHADVDEELIYQLTKTIWENRQEIVRRHPAGRFINEENAAMFTGVPFHPGAERFYKEIGIWPEESETES